MARHCRLSFLPRTSTNHSCWLLSNCQLWPTSIAILKYDFRVSAHHSHNTNRHTVIKLPLSFIRERFFTPHEERSPFVQQASWFEDIVIRCVRYAFAYIPANIGRVFFSKEVALPFLKFRMFRHGLMESPIHWHEVNQVNLSYSQNKIGYVLKVIGQHERNLDGCR